MDYDISVIIPSLREEFLVNTVENIIKNSRAKTEVIVVLDGEWSVSPIPDYPNVRIIYTKNLGQRGATNLGAKLSTAKWIVKCDAHCAFDEGWDAKLLAIPGLQDNWTITPTMKNLHAFNWVCSNCGTEFYQGEKPDKCPDEMCQFIDTTFEKKIYFVPRGEMGSNKSKGPTSTAYRFTPDRLQFKYFGALKAYQDKEGVVAETMSLQGSFFMLTREKYWELNICDESWGGWGQQGTEVALKTWLSGGRVLCHRGTWYAHMFRTNNQVAFPWNVGLKESQGQQQQRARKACIDLFKNNKWDKQTRGLSWLIERFWEPLQQEDSNTDGDDRKWTQADLDQLKTTEGRFSDIDMMASRALGAIEDMDRALPTTEKVEFLGEAYAAGEKAYNGPTKGILYFTDSELPEKINEAVQSRIRKIAEDKDMQLVSSTRKPLENMGTNVVTDEPRGYLCMFHQILRGLEELGTDIVFMAEHDCLYPPEHFDFIPTEHKFYFNQNWWKVHDDGVAVSWRADQVSGLVCYRELAIEYYRQRIATFDKENFDRKFEPMSGEGSEVWMSSIPYIDIRHSSNLTYNKRGLHHFRNKATAVDFKESTIDKIPGWQLTVEEIYGVR